MYEQSREGTLREFIKESAFVASSLKMVTFGTRVQGKDLTRVFEVRVIDEIGVWSDPVPQRLPATPWIKNEEAPQ